MRIKFCPYTIILILIFSAFFLHTIFILNEDHALMVAYETGDSGHLAYGLMSLFNYPIFSQHNYYFTSGYGWIFNDISFLVILLLKFVGQLFGVYNQPIFGVIDNQPIFNGAMIAINFTFALLSILVFFKLANLLFANKKISFIASLFFIFLPWAAIYSYWLKSDATGMFFILTAVLYLVKFIKQEPKPVYFYIAFVCLVLTTFSKMYHGFLLFPIFLLFFLTYCDNYKISYLGYIFSKNFFKILILLPLLYLLIILIIHPYAIFNFDNQYTNRWMFMPWEVFINFLLPSSYTGEISTGHKSVSFITSFYNWFTLYSKEPLIYLNVLLMYLLIIPVIFRKKLSLLFIVSVIFCNLYLVIVIFGNRTMHYHLRYIYPIAPLLILNIIAISIYVWNWLKKLPTSYYLKPILASLGGILLILAFTDNIIITTNSLLAKAAYKHSTTYQLREFMQKNSDVFSKQKILMGISVALFPPKLTWINPPASVSWVTEQKRLKSNVNLTADIFSLSWTSGKYGLQFIKNLDLKFLILNEGNSKIYRDYIRKNHFKPIKIFRASSEEFKTFTTWFPSVNKQFKTLAATSKLIDIHRNSNTIIGSTIVLYAKKDLQLR